MTEALNSSPSRLQANKTLFLLAAGHMDTGAGGSRFKAPKPSCPHPCVPAREAQRVPVASLLGCLPAPLHERARTLPSAHPHGAHLLGQEGAVAGSAAAAVGAGEQEQEQDGAWGGEHPGEAPAHGLEAEGSQGPRPRSPAKRRKTTKAAVSHSDWNSRRLLSFPSTSWATVCGSSCRVSADAAIPAGGPWWGARTRDPDGARDPGPGAARSPARPSRAPPQPGRGPHLPLSAPSQAGPGSRGNGLLSSSGSTPAGPRQPAPPSAGGGAADGRGCTCQVCWLRPAAGLRACRPRHSGDQIRSLEHGGHSAAVDLMGEGKGKREGGKSCFPSTALPGQLDVAARHQESLGPYFLYSNLHNTRQWLPPL